MKTIRSLLGYTIAGILVMAVWGQLTAAGGIFGGYLASTILIGPLWFMNHYLNLVDNKDDAAWVDMGLAIGVCGIFRDTFLNGANSLFNSLPTIGIVIVGAVLGGLVAAAVEKDMARDSVIQNDSLQGQHAPEPGATQEEELKLSEGGN
ncbi:Lin0368 family putative glycerol transporter subunit [Enterococcus xiangfangensis]|uniref:Uncharacterized protein n=1 Tax=Enterococcus xiangfangensis TaxID=1296537 RepID=A0ABU3FBR5_9ENTE|nr:hypothetical protein [Enterococcus xiangfangensis]MDT2759910.1 hypothetical protein [Enterococcus xiangfangensis]